MARVLVVAYSRSGNTRKVAQTIASTLHADLDEIREPHGRGGLGGYLRSAREALGKKHAEILPAGRDPADYDVVVLGSPVWAGHLSSPMRRYLADHACSLKQTALFVTEGGSGGAVVLAEMAAFSEGAPVATVILKQDELDEGLQVGLADFLQRIRQSGVP